MCRNQLSWGGQSHHCSVHPHTSSLHWAPGGCGSQQGRAPPANLRRHWHPSTQDHVGIQQQYHSWYWSSLLLSLQISPICIPCSLSLLVMLHVSIGYVRIRKVLFLPTAQYDHINGHSELVIERVSKDDSGTYSCMAENSVGSIKSLGFVYVKGKHLEICYTMACIIKSKSIVKNLNLLSNFSRTTNNRWRCSFKSHWAPGRECHT